MEALTAKKRKLDKELGDGTVAASAADGDKARVGTTPSMPPSPPPLRLVPPRL
jgi:hypothetical protein